VTTDEGLSGLEKPPAYDCYSSKWTLVCILLEVNKSINIHSHGNLEISVNYPLMPFEPFRVWCYL